MYSWHKFQENFSLKIFDVFKILRRVHARNNILRVLLFRIQKQVLSVFITKDCTSYIFASTFPVIKNLTIFEILKENIFRPWKNDLQFLCYHSSYKFQKNFSSKYFTFYKFCEVFMPPIIF